MIGQNLIEQARGVARLPLSNATFSWNDSSRFQQQIRSELRQFISRANDRWTIAWCAGTSHFASSEEQLRNEQRNFEAFVDELRLASPNFDPRQGRVVYTSSAGAVYSGSTDRIISEETVCKTDLPYGNQKLAQELLLRKLATEVSLRTVIARISTVYGPHQNLSKPQGLISRICLAMIKREPIPIYVGLETSRNYIYSADVGRILARMAMFPDDDVRSESNPILVKNVVSPQSLSVAQILRAVEAVFKRRPQFSLRIDDRAANYREQFNICSGTMPTLDDITFTQFEAGLNAVRQSILGRMQSGLIRV
jgi:UDP-glucose 4-epimerase